jgi:D-alanyl-D-alanine carboxypeptidase (penicillin-binding protein 5/6)
MRNIFRTLFICVLSAMLALPADAATRSKKKSTRSKSAPAPAQYIPQYDQNGVPITRAAAAIVLDADSGALLHQKNADEIRQAASTQKLLTALLIAEEGGLERRVVIEPSDTNAEPTKLYLKPGDVYSRRQLLEILLVKSMNDVALALARDNAGSVEGFAMKMNRKARELGATSSRFLNPNGLPAPGQFSTARDMARIALAAYRNGTIRSIVSTKFLPFQYADGRVRNFENTNKLLLRHPYCNGMKTGYTFAAGKCLIASGRYGGRNIIVVLLGDRPSQIWNDAGLLLNWALAVPAARAQAVSSRS